LFFDLFYVAAAYNLGIMLISAMNSEDWLRGIIYFVGIFGPLYVTWETDLYYESRYTVIDYSHRLFAVIRFMFVSFAVLHIKPLDLLGDSKSVEAFSLTLSIFLESLMHMGLNVELCYWGQGDRVAIRNHTARKIKHQLVPTSLTYMAAMVVAAVLYFAPSRDDDDEIGKPSSGGAYGDSSPYQNSTGYGNTTTPYDRILAAGDSASGYYEEEPKPLWALSDLALTLTAFGYLMNILYTTFRKMRATSGKCGDIRDNFVPNNVDYLIHRYGEWIMLMIGESVLSLLIVETTESKDYYLIAALGALTVIVLQTLKFESEPSHADGHALWRNMRNATCFSLLIQILSMALIAFGVSYKIFLSSVLVGSSAGDGYGSRMLAPAPVVSNEASSILFSVSLTLVLVSLEVMLCTHKGVKKTYMRLFRDMSCWELHWPLVIISVFKIAVVLFTATLSLWNTDPTLITICGFFVVTAMAVTRIIGWGFVYHEGAIKKFVTGVVDNSQAAARSLKKTIKKKVSFGVNSGRNSSTGGDSAQDSGEKKSDWDDNTSISSKDSRSINKREDIYEEMFDAVILTDLKGDILKVNQTALEVFRFESKDELVGENISVLVGGGEAEYHDMYLQRFREKSKSSSQIGKQRVLHAKRKDGTEFPCIIGIKKSSNGKYLIGYVRDMTEVDGRGNELTITNIRVKDQVERVVDDTSFDAIVVIDFGGTIQSVNDTAVSEFAYDSKDVLVGQNIKILVGGGSADNHDACVERFRQSRDAGKNSSVIGKQRLLKARRKGGDEFPCIIGVHVIKGTDLLVGYIRNVSGLAQLE